MRKYKQQFINRTNEMIPTHQSYMDIKDQVIYPKQELIENQNHLFRRYILAPVIVIVFLVTLSFFLTTEKQNRQIDQSQKEVLNAPLEVKVDNMISDDDIQINFPLMYTGCDLTTHISTNANWDIYDNGQLIDKHLINLSKGIQTYQICFYRGNKVIKTTNIQISVGI